MSPDTPQQPGRDSSVAPEHHVWRRIPADQWQLRDGELRPISGTFQNSSDGSGMSIHLSEIAHVHSLEPRDLLPGNKFAKDFGMVDLAASALYNDSQVIIPDPLHNDPSHANVIGNKTGGRRRRWSKLAMVLFLPGQDGPTAS